MPTRINLRPGWKIYADKRAVDILCKWGILEAVAEQARSFSCLFSLRPLIPLKGGLKRVQRPENSNMFRCFLAWRLAGDISRQ
jgi:hypothetical protein